jgi:hypothetical protein
MRPRTYRRTDLKHPEVYQCSKRGCGCRIGSIPASRIDNTFLDWFLDCGLDVEATRERARESHDHLLREVEGLLAQAETDMATAEAEVQRLDREYRTGKLRADRYDRLVTQAESERDAATAEVERHRARAAQVEANVEQLDVEGDVLRRLAELEAAVKGRINGARDVPALRAALATIFDRIELERWEDGGWGLLPHMRREDTVALPLTPTSLTAATRSQGFDVPTPTTPSVDS